MYIYIYIYTFCLKLKEANNVIFEDVKGHV